ncbi:MAG: CHAT domain-containing protein [Cyclobacteriaceae bacterium]|nr:CHAT domain-containing protein [Cyclobacteriaceae bacterium]UYN86647.1 MAG: CHAT domain-containing protein [Cyclobacteriaceae bacterium]
MALIFHQSAQYEKALPIFIELSNKFKGSDAIPNYALCQLKIADIVRNYGGVNTAIELLNINERLLEIRLEKPTLELAQNYITKAEALYTANRLTEFKESILKSIAIKRRLGLSEKYLAEDYLHLARYYKELPNQDDSCYYWVQKSLRLAKSDKSFTAYILPRIYSMIGYYYHPASIAYFGNKKDSLMRHFSLSRKYYDSAILALKRQPVPDILMESRIYHNLGNSYSNEAGVENKIELLHHAIAYYRRSESLYEKFGAPSEMAGKDWVIGKAYERLKQYDSAIQQFQIGISRLIPEFDGVNVNELPPLQPTLHDSRFITLVSIKANNFLFKYRQNQDFNSLQLAYKHYEFLLSFNHYLLSKSLQEQELTHWNYLYGSNAYQSLIITAYELYKKTNNKAYIITAYGLIASAKYAWLSKNDIEPLMSNSINASVLKQESEIVKNNILRNVTGVNINELNTILPSIPKHIESMSLANFNIANQFLDTISFKRIQFELKQRREVLLDFYVWGNELYSVIISENDLAIVKHILPSDFNSDVWKLKYELTKYKPREYARIANRVYLETLDSVLLHIPKNSKRVVICPDGNLQNIPWDALVSDTLNVETFKSLNYLLNQYVMRTVITPRHLVMESKMSQGFLGITSDFELSKRFSQIPFSNGLVKTKAHDLKGQAMSSIPSESFDTNILHIASHVVNDSLRPYRSTIFLNEHDSITLTELSGSRIKPKLAILNGCQTGNGTYYQSEGTISFARAFYSLGAESVLMTLWSVDDKATADLLTLFYEEMESGNDLDYSLRNAKVTFLESDASDELANPYYWAGLQLSGKSDQILKSNGLRTVFISIVFFMFIAIATIAYRLKFKKHEKFIQERLKLS